jgi:hypothetical protein
MTQRMTTRAYILRHASLPPSAHPLLSQASNASHTKWAAWCHRTGRTSCSRPIITARSTSYPSRHSRMGRLGCSGTSISCSRMIRNACFGPPQVTLLMVQYSLIHRTKYKVALPKKIHIAVSSLYSMTVSLQRSEQK